MRLLEVTDSPTGENGDHLSLDFQFFKELSDKLKWGLEFKTIPFDVAKKAPYDFYLNKDDDYRLVKIQLESSSFFVSEGMAQSSSVNMLGACDFIIYQDNKWWPQLFIGDSIRRSIVQSVRNLDNQGAGYVVGSNYLGKVAVSILISLGYRQIVWVGSDMDFMASQIRLLKKKMVGIDFKLFNIVELTTLTISGSALLCTMDLSKKQEVLSDLIYFNFLRRNSLVADLVSLDLNSTLLSESEKADLKSLSLVDVAAIQAWRLCEILNLVSNLNFNNFKEHWLSFLQNSTSV